MYIGVSPGLYLSKFIPGDDGYHSHTGSIDVTYENKFIPGFQLGCSFEKRKSNSFFLQTEIYFNHTIRILFTMSGQVTGQTKHSNLLVIQFTIQPLVLAFFQHYYWVKKKSSLSLGGHMFQFHFPQ